MKPAVSEYQYKNLRKAAYTSVLCLLLTVFTGCSNLFTSIFPQDSGSSSSDGTCSITVILAAQGSTPRAAVRLFHRLQHGLSVP